MRRMKYLSISLVLCCLSLSVSGQSIEQLYIDMPQELNPYLQPMQRMELIEYAKTGQQEEALNLLGGQAQIIAYEPTRNYLKVAHTACSETALQVFRLRDTTCVVGVIETVNGPIASSTIAFYDMQWRPVAFRLPVFKAADFLTEEGKRDSKALRELMPIFVKATFSDTDDALLFSNETINQLPREDRDKYTPLMQRFLVPLHVLFE